jgi:hypothetical protein
MTEDATIAIDRTTLQSVYTSTQPGMAPGRCTADRAHPTMRTLGSYGPILHPALKTAPSQRGQHWNCEMPLCGHTGDALRESGLNPTSLPLIPSILLVGMVPHLPSSTRPKPQARRCGVYESPVDKLIHSVSDRGELMSSKRK